jgi:excisionase family DNA binding protein
MSHKPTSDGAARTINELPWKLLTILEVAVMLNLSPHTIRKFVRKGTLKPIRICRRVLFHPDEVARLVGGGN